MGAFISQARACRGDDNPQEEFTVEELCPDDLILSQILYFCTWRERQAVLGLNSAFRARLYSESMGKFLCNRLSSEGKMYSPPVCFKASWTEQFFHLVEMHRHIVTASQNINPGIILPPVAAGEDEGLRGDDDLGVDGAEQADDQAPDEPQKHNIMVGVRLCPARDAGAGGAARRVVIPLHQRLQMIKRYKGCSSSEARRLLWADPGCAAPGNDPWAHAVLDDATPVETPDVRAARVLTERNTTDNTPSEGGGACGRSCTDNAPVAGGGHEHHTSAVGVLAVRDTEVVLCGPRRGVRSYSLDRAFDETCDQAAVYNGVARAVVCDFLNGSSGTVFAYGQTGSGKTYTMHGPDTRSSTALTSGKLPTRGIVPRAVLEIMTHLQHVRDTATVGWTLRMSYVEVFGNDVTDLLTSDGPDNRQAVGAWAGVAARAVLEGHCAVAVDSLAEIEQLLGRAEANKRRAATAMNERSSRAHAILLFDLVQTRCSSGVELSSRICFADLGGSEWLKKSQATGESAREAIRINMGLLALKNCIDALKAGASFVPYNLSTLTTILQRSLGGNCRTSLIVTGTMDPVHVTETIQTLSFGETCMDIENEALIERRSAGSVKALELIDAELADLLDRIQSEERWENRVRTREDVDGTETFIESVLVGAEDLRARYEDLLSTKQQLVGVA
eukprot:m.488079 g.488079  ORF g.488079 m.488079 type:complete len:675 (-) comp21763_c0_seq1:456-2480(-)